ncbi:MAG: MBL fold metallo-hydrolase [Betaproteobacteria bacterium]|nr:MBL fold metallo-hydrolase [Betaproteobacteria bacterium]
MLIRIFAATFQKMLAAAAITLLLGATVGHAAPPSQTAQPPGYYRQQVGQFTITALYDGFVKLDPRLLQGMRTRDIQSLMARMFQATDNGGVQTAVNAFLVHTGERLVLVDAGAAQCFGPTLGNIAANITAAGYTLADIDAVLLTHLHPDHTCGLAGPDGKAAFPRATVWTADAEAGYWLDAAIAARAPEAHRPFFKMAQEAVAPYQADGRFKTFAPGTAVVPGIVALATHGHTPGHTAFLVESGGDKALLWGDIVHAHAVQMRHPEVSIEFDSDRKQAIATRKALFEQVARGRWLIGGAHLPFPGLGHVRKEAEGYRWIPVEYGPLEATR